MSLTSSNEMLVLALLISIANTFNFFDEHLHLHFSPGTSQMSIVVESVEPVLHSSPRGAFRNIYDGAIFRK